MIPYHFADGPEEVELHAPCTKAQSVAELKMSGFVTDVLGQVRGLGSLLHR